MNENPLDSFIDSTKISSDELNSILGATTDDDAKIAIQRLINQKVNSVLESAITLTDTEELDETITAMIEVTVRPEGGTGFDKIAQKIGKYEEVKSVFLMSGGYDITIIIEAKNLKQISQFVSEKLSIISLVTSTNTKLVLKKYKENGEILSIAKIDDDYERLIISP